jgi:uncharacterized protein (TIGR00730 family)
MTKTLTSTKAHIRPVRAICVFCGSGVGANPAYSAAARRLGQALAEHQIELVYGGAGVGLMGETAKATLDHGGTVVSIIPRFLMRREHALKGVREVIVTSSMHERKRLMFERSDAFVALPGGFGTLDELFEQMTWAQLGRHTKPIVIANIERYWDPLLSLIEQMRAEGFVRPGFDVAYSVVTHAVDIIPRVTKVATECASQRHTARKETSEGL